MSIGNLPQQNNPPLDVIRSGAPCYGVTRAYLIINIITLTFGRRTLRISSFQTGLEGDFAAVKAVAAECRKVTVAALCRTLEMDVRRAAEALHGAARPRIHTVVATSDIHLEYKLKKTRAEVIEMTRQAVRLARNFTDEVEFSAEDATRSDVNYLCEVFATAVAEGATILNVP